MAKSLCHKTWLCGHTARTDIKTNQEVLREVAEQWKHIKLWGNENKKKTVDISQGDRSLS